MWIHIRDKVLIRAVPELEGHESIFVDRECTVTFNRGQMKHVTKRIQEFMHIRVEDCV